MPSFLFARFFGTSLFATVFVQKGSGMSARLDLRGLRCPIPVIRLEARMRNMVLGEEILVTADDPLAKIDIPHACREAGFRCEKAANGSDGSFSFQVIAPE